MRPAKPGGKRAPPTGRALCHGPFFIPASIGLWGQRAVKDRLILAGIILFWLAAVALAGYIAYHMAN